MRSIFVTVLVIGLAILLVAPAMAQTEDELVSQFLQKAKKKHTKNVGYLMINGSFGRLFQDNDYNKMVNRVNPLVTSLSGGAGDLSMLNSSYEFFAGFGMVTSPKTSVEAGFSYWLKQGSSQTGDFNLSLVNYDDPNDLYSFELNSDVQVYGFSGQIYYFLSEPPDKDGNLENISFKVGFGAGYYFAHWELWEGFAGFNTVAGEPEAINGKLSSSAPGFNASIGAEIPIGMGGLILESTARYLYLNFSDMKWYNDSNEEVVATVNNSGTPVEMNVSGPRIQMGLKRYFSW